MAILSEDNKPIPAWVWAILAIVFSASFGIAWWQSPSIWWALLAVALEVMVANSTIILDFLIEWTKGNRE